MNAGGPYRFNDIDASTTGVVARVPVLNGSTLRAIAQATNWGTAELGFYIVPRFDGMGDEADPDQRLSADRMTAVIDVRNAAELEVRVLAVGGQSAEGIDLELNVE